MAFVIDSDSVVAGESGHITYHIDIQDMLGLLTQALAQFAGVKSTSNATNVAAVQTLTAGGVLTTGLQPSGDVTGAKDVTAIQAALNIGAGTTVTLGPGQFYLNKPLTIPPYTSLQGQAATSQVTTTQQGTVLNITSTFSSALNVSAAIALLSQAAGNYSTVSEEQHISSLMISGTSGPSGVSGIASYGKVQRVHLSNILVSQVTADGIQHNLDGGGNQPDAWYGYKVFSRFNGGKGFVLRSADSTWLLCLSSNNGDTGVDWFINTTSNSKYIGCRSEHAAGVGFGYVCSNSGNSSGGIAFVGCSTDQSALHGFQIGGTLNGVASFAHATPVLLSGCVARRDGQNAGVGGNFAGIYVHGYGTTSGGLVTISGCQTWPGVNDDGSGALTPKYGVWVDNASNVAIGGGTSACAATGGTAINDDAGGGANTIQYDNTVTTGVGATATMAITTSPYLANYQGKSLVLHPASAPATDPLLIVNQNSGERSLGVQVSGDTNDRMKFTSDGAVNFGPGNAGTDCILKRVAANVLGTTSGTDFAVDTAGHGLQVAEGSNAKQGVATLTTGAVTVSNTSVTASSRIQLTAQDNNTTGALRVSARTASTSFTITSSNAGDSGVVAYEIFEPAP